MAEKINPTIIWKKHEFEDEIGYDKFKKSKTWEGNFYFVVGSDPQLGYIWPPKDREATDWQEELDRCIETVEKINALTPRPQFLVICGDMVNAMPTEQDKLNELQVNDFKRVFSKLHPSISLVCLCGNHDIGNTPDEKSIKKYREEFGQDFYSFWCGGIRFLVINSQFYKEHDAEKIAKQQEQWLEDQLIKYKGQRIIIFQHIPWFLDDINEDDQYFNIKKELRIEMIEKLFDAGVSHIFYGHCHKNNTGFYKNLEMITTNAIGNPLGDEPPGLRIVRVYKDNITHTYYPFEKFPCSVNI
ncbi:serine/threonine-protein phosphatase CPPED1-like [Daktulosphaira vitifoliae]|uniref:serine/threonine-protein phosphatase CPPED1-like n=1 Tax=Daktulosphaira vitifoliae TaxID=58002 RepID=UPI0021AA1B70|nr:serine/threonine-protein phosphatase CPPED1-like [Daktulosphaira vitifoliae]XP_050536042.1 serine/threonine-protein phosphatase CPPED1-like [Daktulosphaira vitifoliae]XP_050536051.1 serine/threonine-protein phosphatase CPPED1-like [Daktulosphaira vitifoliae]XP_050536059.1 serine/threonine-protein phosphatase CPPED1-like [Daktulosphaira vitifoliae]XP_050536068.1 serine/threonine-protein phosphatase CPPED1-like [Daktulosphaira vitifoliae]